MHIGLLFYADTLIMASSPGGIKGRAIANNGFLKALLAHAKNHRITLIVSAEIEKQLFAPFLAECRAVCPVELVSLIKLPEYLKNHPLDVLHVMDVSLYKGFQIRDYFSSTSFPVTGVTHTLGHDPLFTWMRLNLDAQPAPTDTLICTTPTAQKVILKVQAALAPGLTHNKQLNTTVLPLGLFEDDWQKPVASYRANHGIKNDTVVVLTMGRLSNITKVDLIPQLIEFKILVKEVAQPILWILAGAAEHKGYAQFLEKVIQDEGLTAHVKLVPNPTEDEKIALHQAADIFAAPSDNIQETFGLSVIEAMAAGLPVVASDWDGYRALVKHGETGYLVPTLGIASHALLDAMAPLQRDSFNQLAFAQATATDSRIFMEKISELATQPDKRKQMGQKARQAASEYDWKKIIPSYLKLWEDLLAKTPKVKEQVPPPHPLACHGIFDHYPTRILHDEDRVQITERGQQSLSGQAKLYRLYDMEEILNLKLLAELLRSVAEPVKIADLRRLANDTIHLEWIDYHILWLYKFGLICLQNQTDQT